MPYTLIFVDLVSGETLEIELKELKTGLEVSDGQSLYSLKYVYK